MNNSKLSVQLYTARDGVAADLSSALSRIAAIRNIGVEPFDFVDSVDEYARLLPGLGLTAPSAHAELLDQDVTRELKAAQKLGVTTVIDPVIDPERRQDETDIVSSAKKLNAIADQAGAYGLTVGYQNMDDQVAVGSGDVDIRRVLESAPAAQRVVELNAYREDVFEALQSSHGYLAANDDD